MQRVATPEGTKALLNKYAFTFQKKFGQNFLIDPSVLDKIIDAAEITKEDCVIEIGPGIGCVTQALLKMQGKLFPLKLMIS